LYRTNIKTSGTTCTWRWITYFKH